jgi:hypothetical protein
MLAAATKVGVAATIANSLTDTVFEVRQGYKSKDSKRQNADIADARHRVHPGMPSMRRDPFIPD